MIINFISRINELIVMLGIKRRTISKEYNFHSLGWNNSISQSQHQTDIVFLGDSITYNKDWNVEFNRHTVYNLGCPNDTIKQIATRIPSVKHLNPKYIFIMCGINGLSKFSIKNEILDYSDLLSDLQKVCPSCSINVLSILPMSKNRFSFFKNNDTVMQFNSELQKLCIKKKVNYIDIYDNYVENGVLASKYTFDGLHLFKNSDTYSYWVESIKINLK